MRINVGSDGFELTAQLRSMVESRLLSALDPFGAHIKSVRVRVQTSTRDTQGDTTICDVTVSLRPSGGIRARAEDAKMRVAIDGAAEGIRAAVEREVSRLQAPPGASDAAGVGPAALELMLNDNQIAQHQRAWLERPENYLRPVRIRQYWRPPEVEDDEVPQGLQPALSVAEESKQPSAAIREPTHAEIQERAYFRYVERGRVDGFDREDWSLAETELRGGEQSAIREADAPFGVQRSRPQVR